MYRKIGETKLILLCSVIFMLLISFATATEDGKKIYEKKCTTCHGKDGKGNRAMLKTLKVDASLLDLLDKGTLEKSDEELISIISKGINKMPAYEKALKDEEIKDVISYIRSLVK